MTFPTSSGWQQKRNDEAQIIGLGITCIYQYPNRNILCLGVGYYFLCRAKLSELFAEEHLIRVCGH
jgi:hypothetical protein